MRISGKMLYIEGIGKKKFTLSKGFKVVVLRIDLGGAIMWNYDWELLMRYDL